MNRSPANYTPPTLAELEKWVSALDRFRLDYLLQRLGVDVDPAWSRRIQLHRLREAMRPRALTREDLIRLMDQIESTGDFRRSYNALQHRLATI